MSIVKNTVYFLLMVSIMLFIISPVHGVDHLSKLEELDLISKQVYDFTKIKQYEKAKEKLDVLADKFTAYHNEKEMDIESLEMMSRTIIEGKKAFAATELNEERLNWHALKIRLMIDALTHENQPLWKNYFGTYQEQLNQMGRAAEKKDMAAFKKVLSENHQLYMTLRPSVMVSHSAETTEMMDSLYRFIFSGVKKDPLSWDELSGGVQQLKHAVQKVFMGEERSTLAPHVIGGSPYVIIFGIAAIVISTLTYVGWRKYRAEKMRMVKDKKTFNRHK
ncbi:MAG: hypothetical protein H0Z33_02460 [Bacillaceae bacterium]|nr:hypothetical protein [Bacillaceae bacterium]